MKGEEAVSEVGASGSTAPSSAASLQHTADTSSSETAAKNLEPGQTPTAASLKKSMLELRVLSFFISWKFLVVVYVVVYAAHVALWLVADAIIDPQLYYVNGFTVGCKVNLNVGTVVLIVL
jgi:hypothetical protein